MSKTDLGDICGRFLTSRLSKQTDSSSFKHSLNNEHIANEHKRHTILTQKLLFKPYKKNPLDQLRKRYSGILISANNDIKTTPAATIPTPVPKTTTTTTAAPSAVNNHSSSNNKTFSLMMNWELVKDRGSGLVNLGNTCFINASLQCLANTPPLVQWLLSNSHNQYCRMKLEKKFCLFCEAERIVRLIHSKSSYSSSSMGPANPNNLVRRIKDISKTFRFGRQEDASEFLICLIDKIVEACLRSSQPPERLRPSSGTSYEQLCHSQTFLHDLFGLVLRSRVICSRCRYTSDTFEVQYTWIVGVRNHSDLRQSLQQFVCRETLSGENLYRCMKCKQLVPAVKRYTLHKASNILLINLKRFEFGKNSHKLSHLVRYPEYLNVKSYMSEENSNDQSLNYRLYAVLVHVGSSMHSGHYYSYVRSPNNRWYKADDTTMTQCDLNQVLTQHGAYILCYIKETERSVGTNITNGINSTNKIPYQNGKLNNKSEQQSSTITTTTTTTNSKFFTPRQIPAQNLPRQINGLNGHTKPNIVSTNGNGTVSTEKRESIVTHTPKLIFLPNKSAQENKPNSISIPLSSVKTNNQPLSSTSNIQTTSSQINGVIKTNGFTSNSNSYNHKKENDHDRDDDSSDFQQPIKKKQRIEDSSSSLVPSSQLNSIDEQSVPSSINQLHKKKKKKKSHKHSNETQNGSHSLISSSSSATTTDEQFQQYRKTKKHHHHHHRRLSLEPL
ncbi:unnamed protein product [Adineta steineri]|uniref:Ubiquitin carboxyl-terminal hydrolase n=1 Tax=Adineta steineri TaxID=433720 RepID=A0A815R5X9_9BILA|nr:unnamed protein product [Adineta steineri]CAF1636171.1 unnamed protein product [Adineta steineri]